MKNLVLGENHKKQNVAQNMIDYYINLLNQALSHRQSIWTFYTIIITTALGTAFTDNYRKLGIWSRLVLTWAVGAAVWYNFYSAILNNAYIVQIITLIREEIPDKTQNLGRIFYNSKFYTLDTQMILSIYYVYLPLNFTVFIAMWIDEFMILINWLRKKKVHLSMKKIKIDKN